MRSIRYGFRPSSRRRRRVGACAATAAFTISPWRSHRTSSFATPAAVAFYREAFAAEELSRIPTPDGPLMSVQMGSATGFCISRNSSRSWVSSPRPRSVARRSCWLSTFPTPRRVRPGGDGGRDSASAVAGVFWGDLHGQLDDPFGHRWNISQHLRDVPKDEVVAAAARAFG